jgi:PAS domain S-box-containing protein
MMTSRQAARTFWNKKSKALGRQNSMASLAIAKNDQPYAWSSQLSFTSPDADFCSFQDLSASQSSMPIRTEWSEMLSFASPEADFVAVDAGKQREGIAWSDSLSMVSPESDFTAEKVHHDSRDSSTEAWSQDLHFASAESDFSAQDVSGAAPLNIESSRDLSFASPELDFMAAYIASADPINTEWSQTASFASPESDFAAAQVSNAPPLNIEFSGSLSFASPEADFTAENIESSAPLATEWSGNLSFTSPEADFIAHEVSQSPPSSEWSHTLSFASPEADFSKNHQEQQVVALAADKQAPLPRNMAQAMRDTRAVVVTSAVSPFKVVSVNEAWVGLCGYTPEEAVGQSLGELLQGPSTDVTTANSIIHRLQREDYAETVLENYTKEGRQFRNMLRAAPLLSDGGTVEHFVGVLHELQQGGTHVNLSQS